MKKLLLCLLLLYPLVAPAQASAYACSDPYETLDCTDFDISTTNFNTIQPHKIDVGGGVLLYRYNRPQLTTLGYGDGVCILGGNIDMECLSVVVAQKAQDIDARVIALEGASSGAKTFNYPTRSLNTAFQPSTTKDVAVAYSVDIACSLSLVTGQQGTVYLEYADNSTFTTNVVEVARFVNGNTGTLTVGLALTQNATGTLSGIIPAGKHVRLRTQNNTGTPTFTYRRAQEVTL